MTNTMATSKVEGQMVKYDGLGLDNVWLANGYHWEETGYGRALMVHHLEKLERAVAGHLAKQRKHLSGQEFRFLRDMLDMSQSAFGKRVGRDYQTVARWELATNKPVPAAADAMIRQLYLEQAGEQPRFTDIVNTLAEAALSAMRSVDIRFREKADGSWASDTAVMEHA